MKKDKNNLNRSVFEELEGPLDVMEELDVSKKSNTRQDIRVVEQRDKEGQQLVQDLLGALKKMQDFSDNKKNMQMPIRHWLEEATGLANKLGEIICTAEYRFIFVKIEVGY